MSTNNDSIVLEEEIDPNYVPSEEEVVEYASWMGMDLEVDKDLFWIAREGLMAPLPENWKPCKSKESEEVYYFNFSTAESSWDHPCDDYYKRLYEEEKKKKEVSKKADNDEVRKKAREDVDQLMGKSKTATKKPPKSLPNTTNSKVDTGAKGGVATLGKAPLGAAPLAGIEKKALPGIRGKDPLPDALPMRTSLSRDSTPERGRGEKKSDGSAGMMQRPASADAVLGGGRTLGALSISPLPSTVPRPLTSGSDRPSSPEFTDSDVSPEKPDRQQTAIGKEEKKADWRKEKTQNKNLRIHSAVASSSDFGSPEIKRASAMTSGGISDAGLKPKAILGKIMSAAEDDTADAKPDRYQQKAQVSTQRQEDYNQSSRDDYNDLRKEINRLAEANSSLSDRVTSLTTELENEQKRNEVLTSSQSVLQTQLSTTREEGRNMRSELNREIERRARIESELKEVHTQWANAKKENAAHVIAIQEMRGEIHNLEGELNLAKMPPIDDPPTYSKVDTSNITAEMDALTEKLRASQARVVELDVQVSQLQSAGKNKLSESSDNIARLERSLRAAEQERDEAQGDLKRKSQRVRELEDEVLGLEQRVREMQRHIPDNVMPPVESSDGIESSAARAEIETLQIKLAKVASELAVAQRENEEHVFKNRRLESQVGIRQSELEDTESRLSSMKKRVAELQDRCDELELQSKSLTARLETEGDEKTRLEARLMSSKEDVKSLQSQISSLERLSLGGVSKGDDHDALSRAQEELSTFKTKYNKLESELDIALSKLSRKDGEAARLTFELATQMELIEGLRKDTARAHTNDTAEITDVIKVHEKDIKEKLVAAQLRESSLQTELTSYHRRVSALEDELKETRHLVDRMTNKENIAQTMLNKQDALQAELEQKNADLRRELSEQSLKASLAASSESHKLQVSELELQRCKILLVEALNRASAISEPPAASTSKAQNNDAAELDAAIAASKYELDSLRNANKFLQSELELSKTRNKDLEKELHTIREEKEKMYFEHVHAQGVSLEVCNSKLSAAKDEHMKDRADLMQTRLQVEELTRRAASLQEQVRALKQEAEHITDQHSRAERDQASKEKVYADGRLELQTAQEEIRILQGRARVSSQELQDNADRVRSMEQQVKDLGMDRQRLRDALEVASRSGNADVAHRPADTRIGSTDLDGPNRAAMQLALLRENEIARLQAEMQTLSAQRMSVEKELAAKTAECLTHLNTITELRRQLQQAERHPPTITGSAIPSMEQQQKEAKEFFDNLMASYEAKMESALQRQQVGVPTAAAQPSVALSEAPRSKVFKPESYVGEEGETGADSPLKSLREMLGAYMTREPEATAAEKADFSLLPIGETEYANTMHMEKLQSKVSAERKLIQDLKNFLKNENDLVRQRQHSLARDRDDWRMRYQQSASSRYSSEQFRSAKKVSGEQLNYRAERLNDMVHQLRQIQQWVAAREDKLGRLDGVWKSTISMHNRQTHSAHPLPASSEAGSMGYEGSLLDHIELLHRIKSDLDDDVSLISIQAPDSIKNPSATLYQPKQAISPERASRQSYGDWGAGSGDPRQYTSSRGRSSSPPRFDRLDVAAAHLPPSGPSITSSSIFASRLGSAAGSSSNGAKIEDYSNNLRTSLSAYDSHTDWLGNLKKEVSRFGSGAALRHSYGGSTSSLGGADKTAATLGLRSGNNIRDTKQMTDFLSHTKSVFSRTSRDFGGAENIAPAASSRLHSAAGASGSQNSRSAVLRKSIDNAEMGTTSMYRL